MKALLKKMKPLTGIFPLGRTPLPLLSLFFLVFILTSDRHVWANTDELESQCNTMTPVKCPCKPKDSFNFANCSGKTLEKLPRGNLGEIQWMELSHNNIVTLQNVEFSRSGLKNLKKIGLSYNYIREIQSDAFQDLNSVYWLDLSHNELDKIDPDVFAPLQALKILNLDGNKLYTFKNTPFPNLRNLQTLSLLDNSIERLPANVFQGLNSLSDLKLLNNPWKCDCNLREFHNWISERKLVGGTACNSTDVAVLAKDTPWKSMTSIDFICHPVVKYFKVNENQTSEPDIVVTAEADSDLTIECYMEGDPVPSLKWYKDGGDIQNLKRSPAPIITRGDCIGWNTTCSKLLFPELSSQDAGRFACVGSNGRGGRARRIMRLVVEGGGVLLIGGGTSKTWLWILVGLLAFILLISIIVSLIFIFLRRKKQQQRKRVGDVSVSATKQQLRDQTDDGGSVISPLITKPEPVAASSPNDTLIKYPKPKPVIENGFKGARAGTPMPQQVPDYVVPQHGSLRRLPPYLSGSQILVPQEIYHPGYATYDPRQASVYAPLNYRTQPHYAPYGRLQSPFSGSVASFTSEPAPRVLPGPAYVTLPRRRRVPSWSPANYATRTPVPPSPTPSLPVPNLRARYVSGVGPRYDTIGPRTTVDGGSNLSLNKVGLVQTPTTRTPAGFLTPGTPSSPTGSVFSRGPSTPLSGRIPKGTINRFNYKPLTPNHFNFDTIQETEDAGPTVNDTPWSARQGKSNNSSNGSSSVLRRPDSLKIPPDPPTKPKRKSLNLDEPAPTPIASIQGTEV